MIHKRFTYIYGLRIVLLAATIGLFSFLVWKTSLDAIAVTAGLLILYQIYSLVRYVNKMYQSLNRFLQAIKYEDFSQTFIGAGLDSSFSELKEAFNDVLRKFQKTRTEKEEHYGYLRTVIEHIGIGLISFQENGEVEFINKAAKRALKVPRLKNIKSLESYSKPLVNTMLRLKTGEKALVKVDDNSELLNFVIYATEFILREHRVKLVSIQNIQSELEEKEMEAWQNLIRVLTHEIMNSVTPIASLASSVNGMLLKASDRAVSESKIKGQSVTDIRSAVQTIQKRSQGLLHFIDSYRTLTHIPKPDFQIFSIASLFDGVEQLMKTQLQEKAIDFTADVEPETLELTADPELIEQVLINLLLNAILAVEDQPSPKIDLTACMDERGRIVIHVTDNGPGILEEVQEKIFIPFFTTKKNGSGIGLSLSRQVMRMHGGTISVQSRPNEKTVFTLRF